MDILLANWPYIAAGGLILVLGAGVVTLLVLYHKQLINVVTNAKKSIFNRETLFWVVNITFMAFSAYHAAPFYASVSVNILGLEWFAQYVGITAALVLDALVIVFQNARKRAGYKHDHKRARMYMWYIAACCGLNSVANIYTNYQHFNAADYSNLWSWVINAGPAFLSLFPLFIMGMSSALEDMSSSSALDTLDVEKFRQGEEKRVALLEAQTEYQQREVEADRRLIELEHQRKSNDRYRRSKTQRVNRFVAWLYKTPLQENYQKALHQLTEDQRSTIQNLQEAINAQALVFSQQIEQLTTLVVALQSPVVNEASVSPSDDLPTIERHTDELQSVGESVDESVENRGCSPTPKRQLRLLTKKATKSHLVRVRAIVQKEPNISPTVLADRLKISRPYASQLKSQALAEMQSPTADQEALSVAPA